MNEKADMNIARITLPHSWLLALYAIIPIVFIIIAIDRCQLNYIIKKSLPDDPHSVFIFNVFFVLPHIMASSFSFLDWEYLQHYYLHLIPPIILITLGVFYLPSLIGEPSFQLIYSVWTVVHVIGQQFGISLLGIQRKTWLYTIWRWTGVVIAIFIYLSMYMPYYEGIDFRKLAWQYGGLAFAIFGGISYQLQQSAPPVTVAPYAKYYIWFNFTLVFSCWCLLMLDYPFLVKSMPRFIHEISAFMVYMNHDHNRNTPQTNNILYIPLAAIGIPPIIQNPLFGISIGYVATFILNYNYWGYRFVLTMTFLHYYTDSFSWQRDSPHRKFVSIK